MKRDLLKTSEELRSLFAVAQSQSGGLGVKAKLALENAAESIDTALAKLWELNDYLDLTSLEVSDPEFRANLAYWDALPGGVLTGEEALAELYKEHSATLRQLYEGAVDISSVVKFTDAEISAAKMIGQAFKSYRFAYNAMKFGLANYKIGSNQLVWGFRRGAERQSITMLVEMLVRLGYASHYSFTEKTPTGLTNPVDSSRPDFEFEVTLAGFDPKNTPFLSGHWFEAYAYSVFRDQLERIGADFEIYTRVGYDAQIDGTARSKSDFDVLINTGSRLVLVECKSGKLSDVEGRSIIGKTDFLKRVFANTRIKDFMFVLVYSPRDPTSDAVIQTLRGHQIECLQPDELRGFIVDNMR